MRLLLVQFSYFYYISWVPNNNLLLYILSNINNASLKELSTLLEFQFIKYQNKYSVLCLVCKKALKNMAEYVNFGNLQNS